MSWLSHLGALTETGTPCVLITVVEARGSTPREAGTKMVVTADAQFETIGGGNLEFEAIASARQLLASSAQKPAYERYALGPSLAQCCGGSVSILLEPFLGTHKHVFIFGAGHVGREMVQVLSGLPAKIIWVDSRAQEFPNTLPANTEKRLTDSPLPVISEVGADDDVLVFTHSHDLDFELVLATLKHDKFSYLGLIGSDTKRVRFERRLMEAGIARSALKRLTCPIGIDGITGKHPREIAIAVAAELLQRGLTHPKREVVHEHAE